MSYNIDAAATLCDCNFRESSFAKPRHVDLSARQLAWLEDCGVLSEERVHTIPATVHLSGINWDAGMALLDQLPNDFPWPKQDEP